MGLSDCGGSVWCVRTASLQGGRVGRGLTTQCSRRGLQVSEEVREAVHSGKPVVALESTIITHGMPYPHNEGTATAVEGVIRGCGAVPATVGVMNGALCVGLSGREIGELADKSRALMKISRRDLPVVMAQRLSGGTTVSGTMIAAHAAGIPIFATGGIGGVHRGVEDTMDVSADLRELGRTPVAVVSAGVKSILDIPRTLEYLETEGVCVTAYGPADDFPAFFAPRSGHKAPHSVQTPEAAADIVDACLSAQLDSGMLFAVPIPEEFAASGETIDAAIQAAVEEARRSGVKGREVTPFILRRVNELTEGASLEANVALIKSNARVAADIAVALSKKRERSTGEELWWRAIVFLFFFFLQGCLFSKWGQRSHIIVVVIVVVIVDGVWFRQFFWKAVFNVEMVVVGGTIVDFCAKFKENDIKTNGATYVGKVYQSFGGVARNVADCLSRLGYPPLFVSAVGDDVHASGFLSHCSHMDLRGVKQVEGATTPTYCPVLTDSGHVMFGVGDMDLHSFVSPDLVSQYQEEISAAPIVCVDGNFSAAVIERVCQLSAQAGVPVWYEPTDIHKACKPLETDAWKQLTYISPNLHESASIWASVTGQQQRVAVSESSPLQEVLSVAAGYCRDLLRHVPVVMVTLGGHGLVLGCREEKEDVGSPARLRHYSATPPSRQPPSIVNVSGAGDCLNAAMMHFIVQGHDLDLCVKAGLLAAFHSLQSHNAVPASIIPSDFSAEKVEEWANFRATEM
ncbi:LOW QUALITY PROTEIN: uncharacterized protein LOC143276974 [Babylonia areolata]|uniref:LOW QUALITY PROTEIN: uncharacterized protein LOC143276974 n=1 Tax=Babylonia areolata TaxID=304850 RepID=UPI003FD2BECC